LSVLFGSGKIKKLIIVSTYSLVEGGRWGAKFDAIEKMNTLGFVHHSHLFFLRACGFFSVIKTLPPEVLIKLIALSLSIKQFDSG